MSDIVQRLKDSKPDNSICEHGNQKRKCPICERDAEIEQQAATIAELGNRPSPQMLLKSPSTYG